MRTPLRHAHAVALAAVLLTLTYAAVVICRHSAINFDYFSADGAFQLFNPLRRIADGQTLGRDFFFFHGFLIPHLHYVIFRSFGTDLFASEVARWSIAQVSFLGASIYFLRRLRTPWLYAASVIGIFYGAPKMFDLGVMVEPANSLLAVRTALPVILMGWWIGRVFDDRWTELAGRPRTWAIFGALTALVMALGSEQGLAMFLIGNGLATLFPGPLGPRGRALSTATFVISFAITLPTLSFLVAGRYAFANLRFNLVEVPQDQMWYFGSPPVPYLGAWSDFMLDTVVVQRLLSALALAVAAVLIALLSRHARVRRVAAALVIPPVYGLLCAVSLLGIYAVHYTLPIHRFLLLIGAAVIYHVGRRWRPAEVAIPFLVAAGAIAININPAIPDQMFLHARINERILNAPIAPGTRELLDREHLGVRLSPIWANSLDQVHRYLNPPSTLGRGDIWSTYAGMYETEYGTFHPDADYIIHALGNPKRDHYVERFQSTKSLYAATKRRTYFGFESWLQQANWPFYRALIAAYDPIFTTTMDVFWRRADASRADFVSLLDLHFDVPAHDARSFFLPAGPRKADDLILFEVSVDYDVTNPLKFVPVLGKTPRFFAVVRAGDQVAAKVSLPPDRRTFSFPIFATDSLSLTIEPAVESLLLPADLAVTGVRASRVKTSPATLEALTH